MTETIEKPLPQLYREAADLILKVGHATGDMKTVNENGRCFGFCTMGAVFEAAGVLNDIGDFKAYDFTEGPEFLRLASPLAEQIESTGRYVWHPSDDGDSTESDWAFWTIANWNDGGYQRQKQDAAAVVALLRETADAVEKAAV